MEVNINADTMKKLILASIVFLILFSTGAVTGQKNMKDLSAQEKQI